MSAGGRSRAAALALLAGVVAVIGAAVVVPAGLYWSKTGAIIRDARLKTLRSEQRSESASALDLKRSDWDRFVASDGSGFLLADGDEAAVNEIKQRVADAFARLNGSTARIEAEIGEAPRAGVLSIDLEIRGTLPRKNLGPLLGSLESTPAFVIISKFDAREGTDTSLRISISGTAYRLAEGEI